MVHLLLVFVIDFVFSVIKCLLFGEFSPEEYFIVLMLLCKCNCATYANANHVSKINKSNILYDFASHKMANIEKLQFSALDITGADYISWTTNVEFHLESLALRETIKEVNTSTAQEKAKSVIFLRRHFNESIIHDYAYMRDPKELWKSLKERFDHQRDITLPLAKNEWKNMRFQDFNKVMNYNYAMLGIVAKLRYCGETILNLKCLRKHTPRSTKILSLCNKCIGCVGTLNF